MDLKPYQGHFDTITSHIVLPTAVIWNKVGFITPNILTTFGLISSLFACYYLYKKKLNVSIIFVILKMYFDWVDGIYARKYNQVTVFGDWYDHCSDVLFGILLIYIFISNGKVKQSVIIILFGILASLHIGCSHKKYMEDNKDIIVAPTIDIVSKLCIYPNILKWFDCTIWYILIIILIKFYYI